MLGVGMHGKGDNEEVLRDCLEGCTDTEYKTHFSIWAIMNSPLMIGCDIRKMSESTKNILMNKDVIALNQDPECRGPYCIKQWNNRDNVMTLIKPMVDGSYGIVMFNLGDKKSEMSLQFLDMGLPFSSGRGLSMYNCWTHEEEGVFTERYVTQVESHDCVVLRARVVKL